MSDNTRWVRADYDPSIVSFPEPPKGSRVRTTFDPESQRVEIVEFEVPRLPVAPGWYRLTESFGAVFRRDDGAWLDANGNWVDSAKIPDGLIRLVDSPTSEDTARSS